MIPTTDQRQQTILNALTAFPPGRIYLMASKANVALGFRLYHGKSVASFGWNASRSCLTAKVRETRTSAVNLFVNKEGNAVFSCSSCGESTETRMCVHVICTLLTVKNLLQPELFRQAGPDEDYREMLLAGISGDPEKPARKRTSGEKPGGYAVRAEFGNDAGMDLKILRSGEALPDNLLWTVPRLRELWLPPYAASDLKMRTFVRYLERWENRYPIIIKTLDGETQVAFDPSLKYATKTLVDVRGDTVIFTKLADLYNGNDDAVVVLRSLAFHPESKRLGIISDQEGWTHWNETRGMVLRDPFAAEDEYIDDAALSFRIPLAAMQRYQYSYALSRRDDVLGGLSLCIDGEETAVTSGAQRHRADIAALPDAPGVLSLKLSSPLGTDALRPSRRAFSFFDHLRTRLSPQLNAKKRRKVLCRAFFELAGEPRKSASEKIIRAAIMDADIYKNAVKREARAFLTDCREGFLLEEEQLHFHDNAWTTVVPDKQKELLLYRIPCELFGWDVVESMRAWSEMVLPEDRLLESLPLLAERCAAAGIELRLDAQPVRAASWEFHIDASTGSDIDWFELRPEIRCDGKVIDPALFGQVMRTGVLRDGAAIRVIDANTQALLRRIAGLRDGDSRQGKAREIVRVPRLQILDWVALRKEGVVLRLSQDDEAVIERLLNFERIERKKLPERLNADLRPYQREGYDWLAFLYEHRFGGCLADDMGLGKTLQAISLLAGLKEGVIAPRTAGDRRPHLIVVPPSLLFNWEHELDKFYSDLKVLTYAGTGRRADYEGCDVVLTSYGIVRRDIETMKDVAFDVIIFDEAQTVKNIHAGMTAAARRLTASFKLALTGTPLENHIGEYYSIIDLSLPGLLGEYDEFRSRTRPDSPDALNAALARTRPFVLRRTKDKVLKDLPPKTETDVYLELTEDQKALYTRTVEEVRGTVNDAYRNRTQAQAGIIALAAILKLRQICVSPRLVAKAWKTASPKTGFLIENLRELLDEGHSALVFSQFTSFLDVLEPDLRDAEIGYLRLDGSTPVGKRKTLVNSFQSGEGPPVFLLSLKAGGKGLNLTRASYVFHLDPWWNPAVEDQASDRTHRIGQTQSVTITRVLMRHTIEEKMMELKRKKLALYKAVMEGAEGTGKGFAVTKEDFEFLLG